MEIFECRMCGHCCEGKGGIVVGQDELERLAAFTGLTVKEFGERYCSLENGKLKLSTGADGYCVFFNPGQGCGVHEAKPDVCRAWPFFRGNLVDEISMAMAAEYCPGINRQAGFRKFREFGLEYLRTNDLIAEGKAATALRLPQELLFKAGQE
ncbi:MAG: YkgJ family cysteine cluster protein [Desulfovibrio sp.]|nr:YkgJ family cysteine cluster protein [Desulfovibrio sp.]